MTVAYVGNYSKSISLLFWGFYLPIEKNIHNKVGMYGKYNFSAY